MSNTIPDCLSCGACCFGGHARYVRLFDEDLNRDLPPEAVIRIEDRHYMVMEGGHCAQLCPGGDGAMRCGVYERRPTACRAFRAGSFECSMARKHRGAEAAEVRARAVAEAARSGATQAGFGVAEPAVASAPPVAPPPPGPRGLADGGAVPGPV